MGKRKKSSRGPVKKLKQRLDTQFTCLFCNHEKAINCTIDKKSNIGTLTCKICGQSFQTSINSLSEPIDIYSTWIDACEAVAEEEAKRVGEDEGYDDVNDDNEEDEHKTSKSEFRKKIVDDEDDDEDDDDDF
ncbi:AAA ATPase Elf1 [Pichia californica]|uniref:Transcription elongation factor 1 homolog n=1 Tax=Pichia californica TaxID=460514 RepID=A0A9P6WHM5_9ASCO|nr:AAA ATPase Elf1 [[Candida] californica]KAG0685719.1 AAA ATPase Elf1 [[Candida] californica]